MALAGVRGMAQATNGQTKAGTAGKKTERVLVHQKGGQPEDHLDRRWMDGIPSKASGRTAGSPEQTLDHVEWSNSKTGQDPHAGGDRRAAQGSQSCAGGYRMVCERRRPSRVLKLTEITQSR